VDRLVEFLTSDEHPVTMDRYASAADVAEAVGDGVLLLRCTDTRGGTELSFEVATDAAERTAQSIGASQPRFEVMGSLTLNDEDLRVTASIDAESLTGTAQFRPAQQQG
jgi:hypothetical protein